MTDVPAQFVTRGKRLEGKGTERVCGRDGCVLTLAEHTGDVCSICRDPIEHHGRLSFDVRCLAGRLRMARARQAAGVELGDVDALALATEAY